MKSEIKTGLIFGIIIIVGTMSIYLFYTEVDLKKNTTNQLETQNKELLKKIKLNLNTSNNEFIQL